MLESQVALFETTGDAGEIVERLGDPLGLQLPWQHLHDHFLAYIL